jgi:dTDP-4-amino-4,6-dideoxygalactose transaminase
MSAPERIYLSPPDVGELEAAHLLDACRSGWVAPVGPHLDAFEHEVAERTGVGHAVALSSGTAALHLGLLALGVLPGQVVIVPSLTFVATANAVRYVGAEPVFVDCDPVTGNLDVEMLADLLTALGRERRTVGAVVPVDMLGSCADYTAIEPLCAALEIPVLEDAAEALGATHQGRAAGSFGGAAVLSFNGNKIITTSSGGMLLSDDAELVARCRYLATQARQPVAHYEHTEVGFNYRLSNLLAALGRAQLSRLDAMMARRRLLRDRYEKAFAGLDGVRVLGGDPGANAWLTAVVVEPDRAGWCYADLAGHLAARDVETRRLWKPMHLQPLFSGARAALSGAAERLFATSLVLPSGSALDDAQVDRVFAGIRAFLESR